MTGGCAVVGTSRKGTWKEAAFGGSDGWEIAVSYIYLYIYTYLYIYIRILYISCYIFWGGQLVGRWMDGRRERECVCDFLKIPLVICGIREGRRSSSLFVYLLFCCAGGFVVA